MTNTSLSSSALQKLLLVFTLTEFLYVFQLSVILYDKATVRHKLILTYQPSTGNILTSSFMMETHTHIFAAYIPYRDVKSGNYTFKTKNFGTKPNSEVEWFYLIFECMRKHIFIHLYTCHSYIHFFKYFLFQQNFLDFTHKLQWKEFPSKSRCTRIHPTLRKQ